MRILFDQGTPVPLRQLQMRARGKEVVAAVDALQRGDFIELNL